MFVMGSGNVLFTVKIILLSTVVMSMAVMGKFFGPPVLQFASLEVPRMYSLVLSWLTPPYLYFVVNGIIITIAASSRFNTPGYGMDQSKVATLRVGLTAYEVAKEAKADPPEMVMQQPEAYGVAEPFGEVGVVEDEVEVEEKEEEEEFVISRSDWTPASQSSSSDFSAKEKPPVSSRIGSRKTVKASPEGKSLRVSRWKKNETLENTWKMIADGRAMPLARHLKKSDTWETQGRIHREPSSPMKKLETFNERRTTVTGTSPSPGSSGGSGRLRKEPSLSQDELNRRVEAFINKFNEEMRLQRQESSNNYWSMVNVGNQ